MKNAAVDAPARRDGLLLTIGFIFFCNPVLGTVDVLPDAVGALLVALGLRRAAYSSERLEKASRFALWLFVLEAIKLVAMFVFSSFGLSMNSLLTVTAFVIGEGVVFALLFVSYFGGIDELSMVRGTGLAAEKCRGARFTAFLFLAVRLLANWLPELFALANMDLGAPEAPSDADFLADLLTVRPLITTAAALAALVVGVFFAVRHTGAVRAFFSECGTEIGERYVKNYSGSSEKVALKHMRYAVLIVDAAAVFAFDLSFDGVRLLPVGVTFALIFISTFIIKNEANLKPLRMAALAAAAAATVTEIYRAAFVVPDPVVFYETSPSVAAVCALLVTVTASLGLLSVRFLLAAAAAEAERTGRGIRVGYCWAAWCAASVLWALTAVLPYLSTYVTFVRLVCTGVFVYGVWHVGGELTAEAQNSIDF